MSYYEDHRERCKALAKKYYEEHREQSRANKRRYAAKPESKEKMKHYHRKRHLQKYGLTPEAHDAMLSGQGGVCAACGTDQWRKEGPVVDHDHGTGKVRGILCGPCNSALGLLGDDPGRIRKLADYIEARS